MKVILSYSATQLECAVNFIATHNEAFKNQFNQIEHEIMKSMKELCADFNLNSIGSMGFRLIPDRVLEDMDSDHYVCRVEILVDPSLSEEYYSDDIKEEVIDVTNLVVIDTGE
jgi:hypothetical protein